MGKGRSGKDLGFSFSRGGGVNGERDGRVGGVTQRDGELRRRYIPTPGSYYDFRQRYMSGELKEVPVGAIEEQVRVESEAYKRMQAEGGPLPPSMLEFNYPSGSKEAKWQEVELRLRKKYGLPVRTIAQQQ